MAPTVRSLTNSRLSMLAKPRTLSTRAEFAADIGREWLNSLEALVTCGRRLNEAKATLPHGDYEAMVASDLPFSTATARKLREIATFVDTDKVPLDRLPEAMSTLYAIATLPDETRHHALEDGRIRPDTTRAEVEALKPPKPARAPQPPKEPPPAPLFMNLFAGTDPQDEADEAEALEPVVEPPRPAPPPAPPRPAPIIDVEPVPVAPALPAPAAAPEAPGIPWMAEALTRPWTTLAEDDTAVAVTLGDGRVVTLAVVIPFDPRAADVVARIVTLHNAALAARA